MTADEGVPALHVPERTIPIPASLSPQAQAVLAMAQVSETYPALDDLEGWKAMIATNDERVLPLVSAMEADAAVDVEERQVAGVSVFVVTPHAVDAKDQRVYLELHGGGLIMGGGQVCRAMAVGTAVRMQARTWSVDYRMPPEHPYPAALDDCLAVYRALLVDHQPEQIIVGGGSAGGNLSAALVLRARDEGLPLPAAVVLNTPEIDLTESGDSFYTNLGIDNVLTGSLMPANLLYANGHDLSHHYLSPLFGDFSKGFPPTLLSSGTRDLFLSNTVRMHRALRAAGVPAELHLIEAAPHGGFFGIAPEDAEIAQEVRLFAARHWTP
jgi:epsilon-lactone hydrolase